MDFSHLLGILGFTDRLKTHIALGKHWYGSFNTNLCTDQSSWSMSAHVAYLMSYSI